MSALESTRCRRSRRRAVNFQLLIGHIEAKIRAAQERGCTYADIAKPDNRKRLLPDQDEHASGCTPGVHRQERRRD